MKYLLLILVFILTGCSNSSQISPQLVNKCSELAFTLKFKSYVSDMGTCVLKKNIYGSEYTYYISLNQMEGALRIVDLQRDVARAPLLKVCLDKCKAEMPKRVCPGDNSLYKQKCVVYCNDAANLDEANK